MMEGGTYMFTITQIVAHEIGDYWLQSGWMADNKTKRWWPALVHATVYSLPFIILCRPSFGAWLMIVLTHFVIDRWRLARYVAFLKDHLAPKYYWKPWKDCRGTGYPDTLPPFLSVWLMIRTDNVMHWVLNAIALSYL